jgi:hypothetical protein
MAQATTKQYVLPHPKREHCRAHYVKRVETYKLHGHKVKGTYCVYVAPKPAAKPRPTSSCAPGEHEEELLPGGLWQPEPATAKTVKECVPDGNPTGEFEER